MNTRCELCVCGHWRYDHEDENTLYEKCENCDCPEFEFDEVGDHILNPNTPHIGDRVRVCDGVDEWTSIVRNIDDFGNYWCATWWESLFGHSTYHEPKNVRKL